jgi:hypothetical protein
MTLSALYLLGTVMKYCQTLTSTMRYLNFRSIVAMVPAKAGIPDGSDLRCARQVRPPAMLLRAVLAAAALLKEERMSCHGLLSL